MDYQYSSAYNATPPPTQTAHALARLQRYAEYRAFYQGDQWNQAPAPGERRLTFNYARVFVHKAASYLLSKAIDYDCRPTAGRKGQAADAGARTVEQFLETVGDFNNLPALDLDTGISSALFGDGAWTVRWDAAAGLPRVTSVDPATLTARWRADDLQTLLHVCQTYWTTTAELTAAQAARLPLAARGSDLYQPLQAREEWTPSRWSLRIGDTEIDGGPNPYGVIPYILFPNLRVPQEFWGDSDLVDLLRLQRELNSRLSIFSRILEVAGNPVAVITGADADSTDSLKLGPNQLWTLPEGATADVLDLLKAGGADAHFRYLEVVYRAMHDIAEMPRTSFGDTSSGSKSGVALEIELQPLLHKLARKRAILTSALTRRAQLILQVARLHGVALDQVLIGPVWPPVLPQDRAALVSQETALVTAGLAAPTSAMSRLNVPDPTAELALVLTEGAQLRAVLAPPPAPGGQAPIGSGTVAQVSPATLAGGTT